VETRDFLVNVPQSALSGELTLTWSAQNLLEMKLEPSCKWTYSVDSR
jgi:hypothetical protein